jgi:hypothetical protein
MSNSAESPAWDGIKLMACEDAKAFDTVTLNMEIILHSRDGLEK